ncbi:MAG: SDR family oxidoreductase [Fibrobacteres bacterium]|nr:SDR family oxidoreductase [Fibrobacterota bacterium]
MNNENTPQKHLVAGGFGFFGQYLTWLLLRKGHHVTLIGRGDLEKRVETLFTDNKKANDGFLLNEIEMSNLSIIQGDIGKVNLGLSDTDFAELVKRRYDAIWNSAAHMRYEPEHLPESRTINVEGTRRLVNLANKLNSVYNHISTAFIGGKDHADGSLIAEQIYKVSEYYNSYDRTKSEAEEVVKSTSLVPYRIFRPSIIIGDSVTGFSNSNFGFYEYVQLLQALKKRSDISDMRVVVPCNERGCFNIVPVDVCANIIVKIALQKKSANRIFTISDPAPMTYKDILIKMGEILGVNVVPVDSQFGTPPQDLQEKERFISKFVQRATTRNSPFVQGNFKFSTDNSADFGGDEYWVKWKSQPQYFKKLIDAFV